MKNRHTDPRAALQRAVQRWPSDSARSEAERLVAELCAHDRVEVVVVFGSAVRSTAKSFDLDLLYLYRGEKPNLKPQTMEVDLRGYSVDEVQTLAGMGHDLICWSIKFGVPVCDQREYWQSLVARVLPTLPLPSAPATARRAQKAWQLFTSVLEVGDLDAALEQYVTYLTHEARLRLIEGQVYPASRPELPDQLHAIGAIALADRLRRGLRARNLHVHGYPHRLPQLLKAAERHGSAIQPRRRSA